jgi:hypothetical protein
MGIELSGPRHLAVIAAQSPRQTAPDGVTLHRSM